MAATLDLGTLLGGGAAMLRRWLGAVLVWTLIFGVVFVVGVRVAGANALVADEEELTETLS